VKQQKDQHKYTKTKTTQLRKLSPKEVYVGKREIEFAFACEREFFSTTGRTGRHEMWKEETGQDGQEREKDSHNAFAFL